VLTDTTVSRDGVAFFHRRGTGVEVVPGSALEAAYGDAGNLSAVITGPAVSPNLTWHLRRQ
jgi:hypothetical protein